MVRIWGPWRVVWQGRFDLGIFTPHHGQSHQLLKGNMIPSSVRSVHWGLSSHLCCFPVRGSGAGLSITQFRKSQSETWDRSMNPFYTEPKAVVSTYFIYSEAVKGTKGRSDRNEALNSPFCYQYGKQNRYLIRNCVHQGQIKYHATIFTLFFVHTWVHMTQSKKKKITASQCCLAALNDNCSSLFSL